MMQGDMRVERMAPALAMLPFLGQRRGGSDDLDSIFGYILVGLVVGVLARLLVPGRVSLGVLGTIALGIVGAVIGGWLAGEVFPETEGVDWMASILVAVLLVLLVRAATRRTTRRIL